MTDEQTPETIDPPAPRRRLVVNPNRIAVYLTVVAALLGGLAPAVAALDLSSTVGIVSGIAAITAVVDRWLKGWQTMEQADYQAQLMARSHVAQMEQAASVGKAGSRASRVAVPGGLPR